jgi:hypothetical protein
MRRFLATVSIVALLSNPAIAGLESGTYIGDLVDTNPTATDVQSQGDDHIRLLKDVLQNTFPDGSRAHYHNNYVAKTTTYTVVASDENKIIGASASGGAWTLTLPVSSISTGMRVVIAKTDTSANAVTITPSSGTINGETSIELNTPYSMVEVYWNGSTWYVDDHRNFKVRTITGDATLDYDDLDSIISAEPASANITLTLPASSGRRGRTILVKLNSADYDVVLDGNASETIDGSTTKTLSTNDSAILIVNDGSNWQIVNQFTGTIDLLGAANTWTAAQTHSETVTFNDDIVEAFTTLTDAATVAWDLSTGTNFVLTLGGNRTLGAATNGVAGQRGYLRVVQDGTGGRTLDLSNAIYDWPGANSPDLVNGTASLATVYHYLVISSSAVLLRKVWDEGRNSIGNYRDLTLTDPLVASTTYSDAHGLGKLPALVVPLLKNTSTDCGYAANDYVVGEQGTTDSGGGGNDHGIQMGFNTTNIITNVGNNGIAVLNKSTQVYCVLDLSKWDGFARVYE